MLESRRRLAILVVALLALSSCAGNKRPVLYRDPAFSELDPLRHECAVLIVAPIEIRSMVQEFISAFDGDPGAGAVHAERVLVECLTGQRKVQRQGEMPMQLRFRDLSADLTRTELAGMVEVRNDEYGVAKLSVLDEAALSSKLGAAGPNYLVLISGLRCDRESHSGAPVVATGIPGGGPLVLPGRDAKSVQMTAQVFVLRTDSLDLVWNGFVRGSDAIQFRFTRGTIDGAAEAFALDLLKALRR